MDAVAGLAGIQARIAEIQSRFAASVVAAPAAVTPASRAAGGDFASHLQAALGGASALGGVSAPASASAPRRTPAAVPASRTGGVAPPPALVAYGNGRIPAAALQPLGIDGHRLWGPAATAFTRLHADATAAGVALEITDSYRSYDEQVDLAQRKGLYSQGGLAATPGTSNHGWGLSVDLGLDTRAQAWMRQNAGRYGFVEDVPREPWHWTFHGTG